MSDSEEFIKNKENESKEENKPKNALATEKILHFVF